MKLFVLAAALVLTPRVSACSSDRPGSQTHRTLHIPRGLFNDNDEERRMTEALCCVYTYVEMDDDYDRPWMELYQGWQWMNVKPSAVLVMEDAMNDICAMPMGAQDCSSKAQCVQSAKSKSASVSLTSQELYSKMNAGDFAAVVDIRWDNEWNS